MKKVTIEPGCIACVACEFSVPEIFQVTNVSQVKKDALVERHEETIKIAAQACPVAVIIYED